MEVLVALYISFTRNSMLLLPQFIFINNYHHKLKNVYKMYYLTLSPEWCWGRFNGNYCTLNMVVNR